MITSITWITIREARSDAAGGVFFIRTNSAGRTYRLVTAPAEDPVRSRWHEVMANRPGVMLAGHGSVSNAFGAYGAGRRVAVLADRGFDASKRPALWRLRTALMFAEPAYNATLGANPEFDTGTGTVPV